MSAGRIQQLESRDEAGKGMAERRAKLREAICAADDPEKHWPVNDMVDAIGLLAVTKRRLVDYFARAGRDQITIRELMDLCSDFPEENRILLLKIPGIGKKGFWSLVNGLTNMDQGSRCNEEWQNRLSAVKRHWGIR